MPNYCCVPGCRSRRGHLFPLSAKLQMKWRVAINRGDAKGRKLWRPNLSHDVLCSDHFVDSDYVQGRKKRTLKSDAVPSVFSYRGNSPRQKPASCKLQSVIEYEDVGREVSIEHVASNELERKSIIVQLEQMKSHRRLKIILTLTFGALGSLKITHLAWRSILTIRRLCSISQTFKSTIILACFIIY